MSARTLAVAAMAATGIVAAVVLARQRMQCRDALIATLTAELTAARHREGALGERLDWYRASMQDGRAPLRIAQAPRSAARFTAR